MFQRIVRAVAVAIIASGCIAFPLSAQVVINELMFHPQHADDTPEPIVEEFVELINTDPVNAVDLTGWRFSNGVDFTFGNFSLPPGGFVIVAADTTAFSAKYPTITAPVVGPWTGRLSNSGERIRLLDALGEEVDDVTYSDEGDWALRRPGPRDGGHTGWVWKNDADGAGSSLELINPAVSNEEGQNWSASIAAEGTPGAVNSVAAANIAPIISNVRHTPAVPLPTDQVVVTATLIDELATGTTATLYHRGSTLTPGSFSAVPMVDLGDNLFGGILPAQANRTVVEFFIESSDGTHSRRWPSPTGEDGAQNANLLYQVDNGSYPGSQGDYRLILSAPEAEEFTSGNFNRNSDAQMNATFISLRGSDEDIRYQAGLRRRGAGSRSRQPLTLRLNLPGDRPWRGETAINLNSQYPPLQILGQKLYAAAGIAAPDARPVQLRINGELQNTPGSANFGTYVHIEPLNGDFIANHIPTDDRGNLYRKRRPDSMLSYENGDVAAYRANGWEKQTNTSDWDWSDLDAMHAALNDAANPNYLTNLEASINVDQWLRWIAIMTILANGETNIANGTDDDYAIYRGITDPRFILVPHDLDTILGIGDSSAITDPTRTIYDMFENGPAMPVMEDFIRHPGVLPLYHTQLFDLLHTTFEKHRFDQMVDLVTGDLFSATLRSGMKEFMDQRRASILTQIQPVLTVSSTLPTANGYAQSSVDYAFLNGIAEVRNTSSIQVNGQTAEFSLSTGQWSFGTGSVQQQTILPRGSEWKYLDDGSDQGTAWQTRDFDDSAWQSGPAELGYGDNDSEATIVRFIDTDLEDNGIQKNATTYFRSSFEVANAIQITQVIVRLRYDDGGIVYINGTEAVVTDNMNSGALYNEFALDDARSESNYQAFNVPASLLTEGTNFVAVEIHQRDDSSSDISFDLEVEAVIDTGGGSGVSLDPGVNRITVESLDSGGHAIDSAFYDVWFDDGSEQALSGTLANDTTLTAAEGPYRVTRNLTVPIGVTLTIQPGASLFFDAETRLTVNGKLVANGENHRHIRFTSTPGGGNWAGVYFNNSLQDNSLSWMDQEFSDSASHSIEIVNSRLTLDHVTWSGTMETILEISHPQLLIRDCVFPSTSGSEVIHGDDLDGSDYFVLDGNVFKTSSGYNDIIDFSGGRRPGPIIYVLNNLFTGATDDCLDLDGIDAHIEGNTFRNVHTDDPSRDSTSNAIATDGNAHITVVRNIFDNVDHAMLLKNDADAIFENNIVRGATFGAIHFNEILRDVDAGSHVVVEGNIFVDNAMTFLHTEHLSGDGQSPLITANQNIMPQADHRFGTGNLDIDPLFANPEAWDFSLLPGSGAIGAGVNGADMGALIPRGATVSGEPPLNTGINSATLDVHIPGISDIDSGSFISEYRWRLDGVGGWSAATPMITPIFLSGLTDGAHFVEVVGKDSAGIWQTDADATRSLTWNIITGYSTIQISEVLAINSAASDMIELHNSGITPANVSGMKLSDDPLIPKIIFPIGSIIPATGYFVVSAESIGESGFALSGEGDAVYLFDSADNVIDSITFGIQVEDLSLSRVGRSGEWALSVPTLGNKNVRQPLGDSREVFINEWLASGDVFHADDFIELYVASPLPVDISGFHMSDAPDSDPARYQFPPHSYLKGQGFKVMVADNDTALGANHLNFQLNANVEWITISDPALSCMDIVAFTNQQPDQAQGRIPDGGASFVSFPLPTSGLSNVQATPDTVETMTLADWGHTWKFLGDGSDQGSGWRNPEFDDSGWSSGPGLLGDEDDSLPGGFSIATTVPVTDDFITYYFRSSFDFAGDPQETPLQLETLIDDSAVFYLNGVEIFRQNLPIGDIDFLTRASDTGEAGFVGPVVVPSDSLIIGPNVLAVEVHQINSTSSDIVMGMKLAATETIPGMIEPAYQRVLALVNDLRITEIMYHPDSATAPEFIEFQNIGSEALDLTGVRFTDGIDFVFPAMTLAPGEFAVIVNDLAAFQAKYGNDIAVAGEYTGSLSNGGETLTLKLPKPYDAAILRFDYDDAWYPQTDGLGYSLEIVNRSSATNTWSRAFNWQIGALQGTPGDIGFDSVGGGLSQHVVLPASATLTGEIIGTWSPDILWEKISGPGAPIFADPSAINTSVAITEPGTYTFRVTATSPDQTVFDNVTVVVDDVYSQWQIRNGASDESSDDDGDGLTNLIEYALDSNPLDANTTSPEGAIVSGFGATAYELIYTLYPRKSDITYRAETSDDLIRWSRNNDVALSSEVDREVRKVSTSVDASPQQFIRLMITK